MLRDPAPAPDPHLPATGVSLEWERWLSPAFIRAPGYGTRCSSVVLRDRAGRTRLVEWTWDVDGALRSRVEHEFAAVHGLNAAAQRALQAQSATPSAASHGVECPPP